MKCFCGCGTKVSSRTMTELNLQASRVALELLAWDRARHEGKISPQDGARVESLIVRGSNSYRRLLMTLHGERESTSTDESEQWLRDSYAERRDRASMTEEGSFLRREKLRLTDEDLAVLDRRYPEQSFSHGSVEESRDGDVAGQLERLGALHSEGLLNDEEFAAAKARVLG